MKPVRTLLAAGMAMSTLLASTPMAILADEPVSETETIFAQADADGTITKTDVSTHLHSDDGIGDFSQVINLSNVKDTKTGKKLNAQNGQYSWNTKESDVYYQGSTTKALPVKLSISYQLDGKEISKKELKKASGHLTMTIKSESLQSKTIQIGGQSVTIHPLYAVAGGVMWDQDHAKNIHVNHGQSLSDSQKDMVGFVAFPGIKDTLKDTTADIDSTIVVEADVDHLDLGDMYLAIKPVDDLASVVDDSFINKLSGQLNEMVAAQDQLVSGSETLASALATMDSSVKAIPVDKVGQLSAAFDQLNGGTTKLASGVNQYTAAVDQIKQQAKFDDLLAGMLNVKNNLDAMPEKVNGIKAYAQTIASQASQEEAALTQIKAGIEQKNAALAALKADLTPEQQLTHAAALAPINTENLDKLIELSNGINKEASGIAGALDQLNGGLGQLSTGVGSMHDQAAASLAKLSGALEQLSSQSSTLRAGAGQLSAGTKALVSQKGQMATLAEGLKTLQTATTQLADGSSQLASGQHQFKEQAVDKLVGAQADFDALAKAVNAYTQEVQGFASVADKTSTTYIVKID